MDLGATFDLAGLRPNNSPRDGVGHYNVHSIAISVPIATVSKTGTNTPANILDGNYVIGVWASASRPTMRTLNATGGGYTEGPAYVQVSRLGMPLTNEVINPIGAKDAWNARSPYNEAAITDDYLSNPELGLYTDSRAFGTVVPAVNNFLQIQTTSLNGAPGIPAGGFDFGNGHNGLAGLAGSGLVAGTALAPGAFGPYLLVPGKPRSVDIKPIFHTGVPNLPPYQLATGKTPLAAGNPTVNPLTAGKPFVNNFLYFSFPRFHQPRRRYAAPEYGRTRDAAQLARLLERRAAGGGRARPHRFALQRQCGTPVHPEHGRFPERAPAGGCGG